MTCSAGEESVQETDNWPVAVPVCKKVARSTGTR